MEHPSHLFLPWLVSAYLELGAQLTVSLLVYEASRRAGSALLALPASGLLPLVQGLVAKGLYMKIGLEIGSHARQAV